MKNLFIHEQAASGGNVPSAAASLMRVDIIMFG